MSLPDVDVVRSRIEAVPRRDIRYCLVATYLYAGRISEVVGKVYPSDSKKTAARGPRGRDATIEIFRLGPLEEEAIVFSVRTAKRDGLIRKVALPLNYEPWAKPLYDYFQQFSPEEHVFPFYQQNIRRYCQENKVFDGLTYLIMRYKTVKDHIRPFTIHALRHVRTTELVEHYKFDPIDLAIYGGWKPETATRHASSGGILTRVMSRYLHTQWERYFPKLLKKRW